MENRLGKLNTILIILARNTTSYWVHLITNRYLVTSFNFNNKFYAQHEGDTYVVKSGKNNRV